MFKPTDWSAVQFGCAMAALIITAGCIKAGQYGLAAEFVALFLMGAIAGRNSKGH